MQVLEKTKTPRGIDIQIEDWSENFPEVYGYSDTLAAFPKTITNPDNQVRLEIQFKSYEEAKEAMKALEAGEKELRDYRENFNSYSNEGGNVFMNFKE
ncbi:hypothetical protein [Anaerococcus degeneri]|uniref:Uncharacterized protein n=1 Tax=Anaerococcus degeneri TaxID=361500 RepID=A0ABS7YXD7_9FIRM|nr:hypothetical protein [Anaerococcus degeneri]MBP2015735.1 hypothetical protein [Anaerococcus degeneri]MCA2096095.1 hypothetical protein [Anaerococcus degeneri]